VCTGAELNETGRGKNTCAQVPDKKKKLACHAGKSETVFFNNILIKNNMISIIFTDYGNMFSIRM
jgi:hypothetical protein